MIDGLPFVHDETATARPIQLEDQSPPSSPHPVMAAFVVVIVIVVLVDASRDGLAVPGEQRTRRGMCVYKLDKAVARAGSMRVRQNSSPLGRDTT